ncbi:hypothetical protein HMPREF0201_04428 [Cedecea davisae DSM 4568]|uniref:Uncharacterized protein n=1 Tax=Cedecea davisae DSM 4568 TaxID=566551 RepID=S3IID2_9ENTR|nr:hypothetical protein HMPREF0201_04428 [Cedecea davisae DSM 4568]
MKNRASLRRVKSGASRVNDCVKINHCNEKPKQYHPRALHF